MDQIGKYEILDKIGSGGFAVVYKGYDPYIKRPVAIKVCYSRDPETRERFRREAEIAGRLEHRNITTVFDAGVHEQTPYLVEEYLPGEDLAHMIRRQEPENLDTKLDFLLQIADGLGYAHTEGVIHRDIKPGNVRVLESGRVKIMDFGTAKLANVESNLTQTGMTLGTVAYLSPERLLGQPSGTNSDIFSYGVLAYELLSFRRPFAGKNIPNLIDQVLNAAPRQLEDFWPECPPALAKVVHLCLLKDPAERYASCETLITDLQRIAAELCPQILPQTQDSTTAVMQVSLQLSGLLERSRQLYDRGRYARAEVLLDEVLEIDPENNEAALLIKACNEAQQQLQQTPASAQPAAPPPPPQPQPSSGTIPSAMPSPTEPSPSTPTPSTLTPTTSSSVTQVTSSSIAIHESPEERKKRKIQEAVTSIDGYIQKGRWVQAAEALKFATDFLGPFDEVADLKHRLTAPIAAEAGSLRREGLKQARLIVQKMEELRHKNLLPPELAETFVEWVDELDPEDLASKHILASVRQNARHKTMARSTEDNQRKKQEAVASIEQLLDDGNPAMAEKALQFAIRLFGEFDQIHPLQNRIAKALRRQS